MTHRPFPRFPVARLLIASTAIGALAACDPDLRTSVGGTFSTTAAAQSASSQRPEPDARGIISYPTYQVAVARRGDTLTTVANRIGVDIGQLASHNGIDPNVPLRDGEIIALPGRVAEPSAATGAAQQPPGVDISTLAGNAINNSAATPVTSSALPAVTAQSKEPNQHKVARGETAYTIARLYGVQVRDLAEWNSLGSDFAVREGQFLLIPVPKQAAPKPAEAAPAATTVPTPGTGSPTPTPPSAATALPDEQPEQAKPAEVAEEPVADVGEQSAPASGVLAYPVSGKIVRAYSKGKNDGIDIAAAPGTAVQAAADGTVAAITASADKIPIIVIRHPDNLLTVYANVESASVKKGDRVKRGQAIAKLRAGSDAYVHFEVRKGFDSVDPLPYLK